MRILGGGRATRRSIRQGYATRGRGLQFQPWLTIAVVLALMLSMTAIASADGRKARFEAAAAITHLGLMGGTEAVFQTSKNGEIKRLHVETSGELIASDPASGGGITVTSCDEGPAAQEFCDAIARSGVVSLHDSSATMRRPELVEVSLDSGNGDASVQQQLFGSLTGHLHSSFSISRPDGQLVGTARLRIRGEASYGCFTLIDVDPSPDNVQVVPFPELRLSVCQGMEPSGVPEGSTVLSPPMMLPTMLDVNDSGQFKIRTATGKFQDMNIRQVKGKVSVNLLAVGQDVLDGTIAITKGQVHFQKEAGKGDDKEEEDNGEDDEDEEDDDNGEDEEDEEDDDDGEDDEDEEDD